MMNNSNGAILIDDISEPQLSEDQEKAILSMYESMKKRPEITCTRIEHGEAIHECLMQLFEIF